MKKAVWLLAGICAVWIGTGAGWIGDASASRGSLLDHYRKGKPLPQPAFVLKYPGADRPVDPSVRDLEVLAKAMPEGVYPNQKALLDNPDYQRMQQDGSLKKDHWQALGSGDLQAAFYIWANAPEPEGIKAFFSAVVLERAGHILPAIHAYQTVVNFYPKTTAFARDNSFVWYPGEVSMANIRRLCRDYPQLGCEYVGGEVIVQNGGDTNLKDDRFTVTPGRFVERRPAGPAGGIRAWFQRLRPEPRVQTRGFGKVQLVRFKNGDWQMRVDGKPFAIRGVSYFPTRVGFGPKSDPRHFANRWMWEDSDGNGKIDAAYDTWVDANGNGARDADEPVRGDFALLRDMGANAIRMYHVPSWENRYDPATLNKPLLRELHAKYGIRVIMGDYFGAYTLGSGADWEAGTDYTDPAQRARMKQAVRDMVADLKDEPFILFWLLGNENNMSPAHTGVNATRTNAGSRPEAYAAFLNEVAEMIHEMDPNHPVAVGNLETSSLDVYARLAPAIDLVGINAYRGSDGFGSLWQIARRLFDRPVFLAEYGCDAYFKDRGEDQAGQQNYIDGALRDITLNQAGGPGVGNAVGGCVFEFVDEWWKDTQSGDPENKHSTLVTGDMPFPDTYGHEEWFGLMSQGTGQHSPFERRARKAYDYLKQMWSMG